MLREVHRDIIFAGILDSEYKMASLVKFFIWTGLYKAQLSFNHGLKSRLISALLNRVVRSSIIF